MEKKEKMIRLYLTGLSYTEIAKEIVMIRQTVSRYIKQYEKDLKELESATTTQEKEQIIIRSSAKSKYDISYRSICTYIAEQIQKSKEVFIRQTYEPGQVAEFDLRDVTLYIDELEAEHRFKIWVFNLKYNDK
ncbi:helix-turn-helix domain-containing protein [Turicibacter sanguinis]|uniref:helix-turn-helix domain-containing protein n=1 Tax=Turicibacter sanguinis TaxID=154288 RepID=UPI00294265E3|nr:helix-turn-helix domain-containing protein [Turicibacter sanguinis]